MGRSSLAFRRRLLSRSGLSYSLALCLGILLLGGVGFWVLEPRVHDLGDGLWLAFTTAATVGYGDIVPSTPAARVFAVVVVLLGLAVLSLVTASVAAVFVEREERQIERDLMRELHELRTELRALRAAFEGGFPALNPPAPPAAAATRPAPPPHAPPGPAGH